MNLTINKQNSSLKSQNSKWIQGSFDFNIYVNSAPCSSYDLIRETEQYRAVEEKSILL